MQSFFSQQAFAIETLGWMAGCWEQNDIPNGSFSSEQWMRPSAASMVGMSRTVKNGEMLSFEFLRIMRDDKGIFYKSRPSENKEETSFKNLLRFGRERLFLKI
ncbi:MAG: DUF6265 family protein [Pyrinomonadaceae bacterium]